MIAKISNGAKFAGLAAYLHGPGRENEHAYGLSEGGQVIGGNLLVEGDRDGHRWAQDMRAAAQTRPDIDKPVWHMSLRAAPGDPVLTDAQWRDIAQTHAKTMGWGGYPWVMVRHGEDHVHVVVSRVDYDGKVWSRSNDRYKAREASLQVERDYRLTSTARTVSPDRKHTAKLSQGEFRRAERTKTPPERTQVAAQVRAARAHAQRMGGGREHFEDALNEAGVQWRANVASTGRMNGYSFHAPGHVDAQGEPVWWKASELDRSLSWGRLSKALAAREVEVKVPPVAPKRLLERGSAHQERVQAATVAAHQKHRAASLDTMHRGLGQHHLSARLFWTSRTTKTANQAKTWALNVQNRTARRAELERTMKTARTSYPLPPNPTDTLPRDVAPTSATFKAGARAALEAMRDPEGRGRGRGMSR